MPNKKPFWDIDLLELCKDWLSQIWVFIQTAVGFIGIGLPVLISCFVLWYMAGFPTLLSPFK